MSYQMHPQGQVPYAQPHAPVVHESVKKSMSRWWPVSFFLLALVFFIAGGGLCGGWAASYDSYYDSYGNGGLLLGAVVCFAIGGVCKFVAWILLIVWCVRGRSRTTITYVNAGPPQQPPSGGYYPASQPQAYNGGVQGKEAHAPPSHQETGLA
ncbi:uncharacterized protein UV8b_03296 [Ustilaginoidea virens]|uniref:Uncharacterized protein n=1 Tax=Ustilaginoidea virens TaxID=1159556 RepID=A0A063BYP3_USTVR|nr:uncharacterized protein UV8b_03296 [Ustilaginoidea virens]QUC19055.1 hypothetical protein UV8b_03296 [Ustilaginoidea virens]GAO19352.1 hypothetical protein UVI_02043740 [Ustilaginoidea virens]